jgi:16S rRNA (guanine1207-N2)-methyltransferase
MNKKLKCLFYPFYTGQTEWPGSGHNTVFLCAEEDSASLGKICGELFCQQHFKPAYDRLASAGRKVVPEIKMRYEDADFVFLPAPRQIQEMQYRIAQGLKLLREGGLFVCAAANDAGGNRPGKLLRQLGLETQCESKHKAKVFWSKVYSEKLNYPLLEEFYSQGELRPAASGFVSCPGLFGWDKIDDGSKILAQHLPQSISGRIADFGCGFGYLSVKLLNNIAGNTDLFCIDADFRALTACRANLQAFKNTDAKKEYLWEDLTSPYPPVTGLNMIVMNPPFHEAGDLSIESGQSFIRSAFMSLHKGGELWVVANSRLPYEKILRSLFVYSECIEESRGFKVLRALK